jgi:alkanesulfonate monooxygenase SsuD/methylene tetrahydromethanopterin reductase-like flavin-dependent oxidoreductase (luciferase family)
LKTITGVSGAVSFYAAAIDPIESTVASSIEIAKIAEANKFDALFAADLLSFVAQGAIGAQEPLIFLSALSATTTHVGSIATVTSTFHQPFNLARLFGTLDHVSNPRAGPHRSDRYRSCWRTG